MSTAAGRPAARPAVRRATEADVDAVVAMVHELAEYERAAHECLLTASQLRDALFGPSPALFCNVATVGPEVVGFALWFLNFSTWRGTHGIYLEDLYVRPAHRGGGLGRALLAELAAECTRRGYARLEWWVLDWNAPAIGVYRSIGAVPMDEWTVYRLTGPALDALAAAAASAQPTQPIRPTPPSPAALPHSAQPPIQPSQPPIRPAQPPIRP